MNNLLFFLAFFTTNLLAAQCTDDTVREQLNALTQELDHSGFATTYLTRCDALYDGRSRIHDVQVYGGTAYTLVAVCDGNTSGVGLEVFDHKGKLLAQRVPGEDQPMLAFTPTRSKNVKIKVTLADCEGKPCNYGLRLQAE